MGDSQDNHPHSSPSATKRRLRAFKVGLSSRNKKPSLKSSENGHGNEHGQHPPKSRLHTLPPPVSHFLGYRLTPLYATRFPFHTESSPEQHGPLQPLLHTLRIPFSIEVLIWAFIGSFVGLALVQLLFTKAHVFNGTENDKHWSAPPILGSLGASAVLIYGAIEGPLAQPRSFVGGHFISALSGVIFAKLFSINSSTLIHVPQDSFSLDSSSPSQDYEGSLVWLCSSLAAAFAIVFMFLTGTVHPPGGATALLATTNGPFIRLGWKFLPLVLLSCMIMLVWSLIWNNLGRRRYPTFWWHPKFPFDPIKLIPKANKKKNDNRTSNKNKTTPPTTPAQSPSPSPETVTNEPKTNDDDRITPIEDTPNQNIPHTKQTLEV